MSIRNPAAPIVPADYTYGVKVVDIGDLRIARGMTRRPHSTCQHHALVYDPKERRVWCSDCETEVESFDAFVQLVERYDAFENRIARLKDMEATTIHSRAAKVFDKVFRTRNMVPCCPNCGQGILPEDVVKGLSSRSRGPWGQGRKS